MEREEITAINKILWSGRTREMGDLFIFIFIYNSLQTR